MTGSAGAARSETAEGTAVSAETARQVAFFTPAPDFGGAQRVTVNIANTLAARGHDVDLVAGHLEGEFVSLIGDAVDTVELDVPRVPAAGILAAVPRLVSYLDERRPDVLFASRTHTNIAAVTAGRLTDADVHVAITEHSPFDHLPTRKDRATAALAARVYPYADDVVGVSEGVAKTVVEHTGVDPDGTTVLNNPIDIAAIQSGATESVEEAWLDDPEIDPIVAVGRLKASKDFATLLRAFARLRERRPSTRLVIVGKGTERDTLESLADDLGVADTVTFTGYTDNPYAYMGRASVFAMPSKVEGLPTVLIEALACGCPIVSTDCQYGPREILDDGDYGRLTPVGDPVRMAERIGEALDDPTPPERCRERAQHFSMAAGADRYESYIEAVAADD
ncbi:glycosyltransferase [Haloarcula onubensis]|uniref:Glycosyltransferase n=1 Tax=Haloarcula onubensis TaxID=2950539 RepID=A0ABU2FLG5_9EURY|nr:glycosyltransferase [Halomicroarcula sp. S3CR25-11]MDS0281592.1 glycosyltransferase [Halomicroarcula sp. S3CR25-11]